MAGVHSSMRSLLLFLTACSSAAAAPTPATEIAPVPMSGPYKSLEASCKAVPPCGFTDMDEKGTPTKPAKTTHCEAVLDPTRDIASSVPDSFTKTGATAAMTHARKDGEIRIGGIRCDVPEGIRSEEAKYFVFIKRADGWWRTTAPMFEYSYNDKYCGGGLYVMWNDKPTRTIAGVAASAGCLVCNKQAQAETIVELMLRVETTGDKPAVFPFLPVGLRTKTELMGSDPQPDCKPSHTATSLEESWPSDDEVVLDGKSITIPVAGELILRSVVGATTAPGHYRFKR